ncbi:MAG: outer membrane protein assembly factor BamB, partial [Rhodoferax sp.]
KQVWTAHVGQVNFPLDVNVIGDTVTLASSDGTVAAIDARTGHDLWRTSVHAPIAAGVGSDGKLSAVVTTGDELVALEGGHELWRRKLPAQAYTAPLVAGARVFVLAADRSVSAYDGQSGRRLWIQKPPTEPLVLHQGGVLLAVDDTLVMGLSGRLLGLNPLNGSLRWEAPIATARGSNDVERLVDLVGPVSQVGNVVCVRAFQAAVGCVDASRGALLWTKPANGGTGLTGSEGLLFGTEIDGTVVAWHRNNGEKAWSTERLQYRGLTAPLALGRSVVIGDSFGFVHMLSRKDGSLLNRLTTDGSAVVAPPVAAGNTLVIVTRHGSVFGFQPE